MVPKYYSRPNIKDESVDALSLLYKTYAKIGINENMINGAKRRSNTYEMFISILATWGKKMNPDFKYDNSKYAFIIYLDDDSGYIEIKEDLKCTFYRYMNLQKQLQTPILSNKKYPIHVWCRSNKGKRPLLFLDGKTKVHEVILYDSYSLLDLKKTINNIHNTNHKYPIPDNKFIIVTNNSFDGVELPLKEIICIFGDMIRMLLQTYNVTLNKKNGISTIKTYNKVVLKYDKCISNLATMELRFMLKNIEVARMIRPKKNRIHLLHSNGTKYKNHYVCNIIEYMLYSDE